MSKTLLVELKGDQILVSEPGNRFEATYIKVERQPDLVLLAESMDPHADRETKLKFRAEAFAAATRKARELGGLSNAHLGYLPIAACIEQLPGSWRILTPPQPYGAGTSSRS